MFEPKRRLPILLATILLTSVAARPAAAQDPFGLPGDLLMLKARELQVKHDRARVQNDIDRGDFAAMNRDLHWVRTHERSVQLHQRWVRGDVFLLLAFRPLPPRPAPVPAIPTLIAHPQYPGYGYFPSDPNYLYRLPAPASAANAGTSGDASTVPVRAPTPAAQIPIEIVNAAPPDTSVDYFVDGVAYRIEGGGRQTLDVAPRSTIAFNRGSGLLKQRYVLSAGVYEFRPVASGWAFFKVSPAR